MWAQKKKKWGLFFVWTPKNGGHSVCKNEISRQNLQIFLFKNCHKLVKFLKMRAKRAKICNFYVKFDTKVEKRGSLGVDWIKKGVIGCRIGVKKGVYWQALDIHRHRPMGVPPGPFPSIPNLIIHQEGVFKQLNQLNPSIRIVVLMNYLQDYWRL